MSFFIFFVSFLRKKVVGIGKFLFYLVYIEIGREG